MNGPPAIAPHREGLPGPARSRVDTNLLVATKSLRVFAYAFASIVLPIYIVRSYGTVALAGITMGGGVFAGLVLAVSIFATIPFNLLVTFHNRRIGQRRLLLLLCAAMALSGVIFAWNPGPWAIILAAFLGAMSATGTETGPFQSLEQAILSTGAKDSERTSRLGMYNFAGYLALSAGSLFAGAPDLVPGGPGPLPPLRAMFLVYAGLAVATGAVYWRMKGIDGLTGHDRGTVSVGAKSRGTVAKLSALFSLDAFGGGFVLQSVLSLWFNTVHHFDLAALSWVFFATGVITSGSIFLAVRIARRIGLLRTMVFTHLPSSILLMLIPLSPDPLIAIALLFARQSISQMDVPTRQSYMMAVIVPEDRVAAGAITNLSRTAAQGISPPIATLLMAASLNALPFVLGGGFKIAYDIIMYMTFRGVKPPEER